MDRKEILKKAKGVFALHRLEERIIATTDGQFFLKTSHNLAIDHAHKSGEETLILERSEVMGSGVDKPKTIQSKSKKQNQ